MKSSRKKRTPTRSSIRPLVAVIIGVVFLAIFAWVKPVMAQTVVSQIRDALVTKAGFTFLNDASSDFLYYKESQNYKAYAGDKTTNGGHKMRLSVSRYILDFSLIGASSVSLLSSSPSATPASPSASTTDEARQALKRIGVLEQSIDETLQKIDTLLDAGQGGALDINTEARLIDTPSERIVLFENVRQGTDIRYRLNEGGIKEEIILRDGQNRNHQYIFSIDAHGLIAKDVGSGVWYFYDRGTPVFRIPKGWAKDASGAFTNDVLISIEGNILTITVNEQWLYAKERVFPITIDPTIEVIPEKRQARYPGLQVFSDVAGVQIETTPTPSPVLVPPSTPSVRNTVVQESTPPATLVATSAAELAPAASPSATATPSASLWQQAISLLVPSVNATEEELNIASGDITMRAAKRSFSSDENIVFDIDEKVGLITKTTRLLSGITGTKMQPLKDRVDVRITDASGATVATTEISENGSRLHVAVPNNTLIPGTYTAHITKDGVSMQEDFLWGVLVVNTNKSVYVPGETAYVQMAALDKNGHTMCHANLELWVHAPTGTPKKVDISQSAVCGMDNVTDTPDYSAHIPVAEAGVYTLEVKNADTNALTRETFEVKPSVPISIERIGATRINPFKSEYTMTVKVKAYEAIRGPVHESIPSTFLVHSSTMPKTVTLAKGEEATWSYVYQAEKKSPQIFTLGPIRIGEYTEESAWELASDASTPTLGFFSSPRTWTSASNTNLALAQPDPRDGDLMVATISIRPSSSTVDTPSGWSLLESRTATDGGAEGTDAGSVGTYVFYKVADGTEGVSTVTFTETGTTSVWIGNIAKVRSSTGTYDLDSAGYSVSGDATDWGGTLDSDPGLTAGDLVMLVAGQVGDASNTSGWDVSATGVTSISSVNEDGEFTSATGNDIEIGLATTQIWTGSNSTTPTISLTQSAAVSGTVTAIRIRQGSGSNRTDNWVRSAGPQIAGTSSIAVAYPTHEIGDLLVLFVGSRISTDTTPTTPAGWTSLGSYNGGTGTFGADAGNSRITAFYLQAGIRMTGTQTVSLSSGNSMVGQMISVHRDGNVAWDLDTDGGTDSSAGTTWSTAGSGLDLNSADGGDVVLVGSSVNTDAYTYSNPGFSASGIGVGEVTIASQYASPNGNDMSLTIANARITSGSGSNAPTYTMDSSSSGASAPTGSSLMVSVGSTILSTTIDISGTANGNNGATVKVAINATVQAQTATISSGSWTITGVDVVNSDVVTVWVDGVGDSSESTAVTTAGTGNITGMALDTNVVTVGSNQDTSLTVTNLNTYDCTEDEDVMYQAASSHFKVEGDSCAGSTTNSYSAEKVTILSGDTLTIGGSETMTTYDLTITGTLTSGGASVYNVSHDWAKTGTFTASSSTVNLTGSGGTTQTITGTNSFSTLSATGSTARTIKFPSSVTTTVTTALTLTGAASQLLTLAPGTAATAWTISAPSTTSVSYVSVSYSTNSGTSFCATNSSDGGNNTSWLITSAGSCVNNAYSFQRKTWYDGTRYWRSFYDITDSRIEFEYSTDGNSWTENTSARISSSSVDYAIEADSSNAFIVYTVSNDIRGRAASSYPGTGFSWGSEQTVLNGSSASDDYRYPTVARDSSNYIHVVSRYTDGTHYFIKAVKETGSANDLPEDSGDTVKSLGNVRATNSAVYGVITPLTSQNMYITFAMGTTIAGCKWVNGSAQWQNSSGVSCEDAPNLYNGLVGWWKLEEAGDTDRSDSSGNNNTLAESASDTVDRVTGKFGYGADFESDDTEALRISDASQTGLDLGTTFTLSAWINVESSDTYRAIMGRTDSANWSYILTTADLDSVGGDIDNDGFAGGGASAGTATGFYSTSTWTLITMTYDGSTLRIYKNGAEQTSGTFPLSTSTTPYNSSGNFSLGEWENQSGYFDGIMDDARVYNRTLTASEISTLNSYDPSVAGSYDTIDTTTGTMQDTLSAVGDGSGNIYMTYIDDESTDQVSARTYNGTSWGTSALVADSADANDSYTTITLDTTANKLYVFWIDTSTSDIYYASCDTSTSCDAASEWSTETSWQTTGTNTYVTSNYAAAGKVFAQWLDGSGIDWDLIVISGNSAPGAPSVLYINERATTAQSGSTNPVAVGDLTPVFSAIYNDSDSGDIANKYEVIVYNESSCTTQVWDSGASGTSMTNCTQGNRCSDITFGGTALPLDGRTYYWKIKYWDDQPSEGSFSDCTASFRMLGPNEQMRHGNYFFNNATERVYTW